MKPPQSKPLADSNTLPRYNERRVLKVIRRMGEASKADLARQTNLTNTAVGTIVSNLHRKQLLTVSHKRLSGQRGQPATVYRLEATGSFSIGVRVDRNWIQAILIDFNGSILSRLSHELILPRPEMALEIILKDVRSLLDMMSENQRCRLAGIGFAYPHNLESWLNELSLPHEEFCRWKDFDLAGHIADAISIPVCSENDATAASIAELFYGLGRDMDDFLYVFIGPGIGGGVVINGESVRGPMGNAGDLGLIPVLPSNLTSAPQPRGEWDILLNRASVNTLIRHLRTCGHEIHSFSDVNFLVDRQDKAVAEWMKDCVDALAPVLWSGAALLNTPAVVIASDLGDGFIRQLTNKLEQKLASSAPEARTPPKLLPGSFGNDAEVIGAANLPFFYQFSTQDHTIEKTGSNGEKYSRNPEDRPR
jgi:predicted NBD/HSP70 family sugar kinase